ncbi:hypothetical protein [Lysinibacillus sp. NPDC093216]|uniref:hypothetical protein n=1 Tax=Lysinibacillus sp. NPDC093216 TaxID=3390576 RepID=UPI003D041374
MPYLTYEEYQEIGFSDVTVDDFPKLERKASDVLDSITRDFYQLNDLDSDFPLRRDKFKKAVVAQIDYFYDMGATSSHGIQEPATVQIGRTTLSSSAKGSSSTQSAENSLVSKDALMYLRNTGLLYRGIEVV